MRNLDIIQNSIDYIEENLDGDLSLLKRFLDGDWAPEDFLVVPPGCSVAASNDSGIITCVEEPAVPPEKEREE